MFLEHHAIVALEEGLHARPAARLAQLAKSFQSNIEIFKGEKAANAKSTVKIMLMTVKQGDRVRIRAEGDDAGAAIAEIIAYVSGRAEASADADAAPPDATQPDAAGGPVRLAGVSGNEGIAVGRGRP